MRGTLSYKDLMMTTAAMMCCTVASPAAAQTRTFDVPAGPAVKTLPIFAKQAGVQIIGSATELRGQRTKEVKGAFSVEEGLRRLLESTRLGRTSSDGAVWSIGIVKAGNGHFTDDGEVGNNTGVSEILIIGSRSRNVDIRRTENDAQPYVVFNKEEVQSSQATTVEEFLRTRLPQNAGFEGSRAQNTGTGAPFSQFNLRGLGANQTLILVNGRRLAALGNSISAPLQADINGIPLGSIERIEVLPASAGGIYGGNAVGGVINIILRSDYRGVEISANYNDTFDFHAPNGRLDITGGFALEGGRTTVNFGGSISRSGTLRVGDRIDLIKKGLDLGRSNVSVYTGNGQPPRGNGVNIRTTNGSNLVLDPQYGGTNLGSNVTNVALGYGGVGSDGGAALIAGAGQFNLDIPNDLSGLKRGLLTSPEMGSFNVGVRRKFTDHIELFTDYSHFENHGLTYGTSDAPGTALLAANAPTNPFQQAIRVTFPNPSLEFPFETSSNTDMLSVGTIIRLPYKWAISAEFNKTWSSTFSESYRYVVNGVGTACLTSGQPCAGGPALNPLEAPVDFGPYLFTEPTSVSGPSRSSLTNPMLRASGPLFKLPGGSANLTMSIQREATDIAKSIRYTIVGTQTNRAYTIVPQKKQRSDSQYAELTLPLIGPKSNIPLLRELEIRGAVRHDSYTTLAPPAGSSAIDYDILGDGSIIFNQIGGFSYISASNPNVVIPDYENVRSRFKSTNYTLSGRYSPFRGLVFRASYATGFLPPSVVQISSSQTTAPQGLSGLPDPSRSNEPIDYPLTFISGLGNENLRPEKSKSLSVGIILTPFRGFRFSADYTRIRKTDEIGTISFDYLLANPDLFPGRVVREASTDGVPGRIISVDVSAINLLRSRYESVDFQVDYEFETSKFGKFRIYALATWQPDTVRQLVANAPALNYSDNSDGPLLWQGNGGFDWEWNKLGVRWNTQFYNSYNIAPTQNTATAAGLAAVNDAITLQGAQRIPSQLYSDLFVSYDLRSSSGVLNGVRVSLGVQNIFNKTPPVVAISSFIAAGYSTYGDPRLRRFTFNIRKAFGSR